MCMCINYANIMIGDRNVHKFVWNYLGGNFKIKKNSFILLLFYVRFFHALTASFFAFYFHLSTWHCLYCFKKNIFLVTRIDLFQLFFCTSSDIIYSIYVHTTVKHILPFDSFVKTFFFFPVIAGSLLFDFMIAYGK